jgi:Holliday junction resolvasome RuvABC endonuclease subunit
MIAVGIDPGTGSSSALGVALIDTEAKKLLDWAAFTSKGDAWERIRDITHQLADFYKEHTHITVVTSEYFVMRGKGGETLARMVGAVISTVPTIARWREVQNSRVKKQLGGHGAATKQEVSEGVLDYFGDDPESVATISELMMDEEWDVLDAIAIAIAGAVHYET